MKKIFALLLCLMMIVGMVACGEANSGSTETSGAPAGSEAEYKLGMGVIVSMDSSEDGKAQVDATVATVVLDKDGKIVSCRLDVAQSKMTVTDGAVDTAAKFETKMELGDRYGMAPAKIDNNGDGISKEWYEQAKAFEAYVVGKTGAEVKAMTTKEVNNHQISTDDALLTAGCTIDIVAFRDAVVKACADDQSVSFKTAATFTLGVAAKTTAAESTAATAEKNGTVKMHSDFGATVIADSKILASLNDAIQPNIEIDTAGKIVSKTFKATKRELKAEYGMAPAKIDNNGDGIFKEWFEQSAAFSAYVVGKTGEEVGKMETVAATQGSVGYMISADKALLDAGCTIQIGGMTAVVSQAAANAR